MRNLKFAKDSNPIDNNCTCYTCQNFSRAYLRHLMVCKEMIGATLLSIHNIHTLLQLARDMRKAIIDGEFEEFSQPWLWEAKK
jgi:queuine tRNA-ribosyltransferase